MGAHSSLEVRARALRLLGDGFSAGVVAERLGVRLRSITQWAKLAGMELQRNRHGGAVPLRPSAPSPAQGHGRRLSSADRTIIEARIRTGWSLRAIAASVGFSPSTISREIARAGLTYRGERLYDAVVADHRAQAQRARAKSRKLDTNVDLRQEIVTGLNNKFSPQQVAGRLPIDFPYREDMRVSAETIYQALYVHAAGGLRHELKVEKSLRSGRTARRPQSKLPPRTSRPWLEGARLADRPPEAADRAVPGHWEGDLIVGPDNSGLVTLVERRGLFTLIGRLPGLRDSTTVNQVLTTMIESLPEALFNTITWDQGTEMAGHARFTIATNCPVFFCDPHSPWQRPTNENTNGLIRDFYPKGTNFNTITDDEITETQRLLNIRPRATLGFHTPAETLNANITRVALTD